jgi:uncharacterized integral membrane protein (TIGR00697 family)
MSGCVVSSLLAGLVWIANIVPIDATSPVDATSFGQVFGLLPGILLGALATYLTAQLVDVYLFESLRKLSKKKHLWLRCHAASLGSQLVDTAMIVTISLVLWPMFNANTQSQPITHQLWTEIVVSQYLFKGLLTLLGIPLVYTGLYLTKKYIGLLPHHIPQRTQ